MLAAVEQVEGILTEEKMPQTLISELATSTINVSVQYWLDTFDKSYSGAEIHTKAIQKVLTALMDAGINMPGDIIELTNYSGRPLQSEVLPSSEGKTK